MEDLAQMPADAERWNHNIEYERLVLSQVPARRAHALDVGCGEGHQARALATVCASVTGIDPDRASIELARVQHPGGTYIEGDFLAHDFGDDQFDLISATASLHHMDCAAGLAKMRALLRPGGRVVIIGCARHDSKLATFCWDLIGLFANRVVHRRQFRGEWNHPSPVLWPPPQTLTQIKQIARDVLPGATMRWLPLWRYELVYQQPKLEPRDGAHWINVEVPIDCSAEFRCGVAGVQPGVSDFVPQGRTGPGRARGWRCLRVGARR